MCMYIYIYTVYGTEDVYGMDAHEGMSTLRPFGLVHYPTLRAHTFLQISASRKIRSSYAVAAFPMGLVAAVGHALNQDLQPS